MMTIMLSIIVLISSSVFLILLLQKEPKKEKNYTLYALASMKANIWRKDVHEKYKEWSAYSLHTDGRYTP